MTPHLLSAEIQSFIREHELDDPGMLLLRHKNIFGLPAAMVVDQIIGRKKSKEKLPYWYSNANILYPPAVNIAQSSSERAARYKVQMLARAWSADLKSKSLLDLTTGFGVDSYFFSRAFNSVQCIDPNVNLIEITKHNHTQLGATNISYHSTSAEDYLQSLQKGEQFDLIYLDPSRRTKNDQKVFSFKHCAPNVLELQDQIWNASERLLVKASPLLDIDRGLSELSYVKRIVVFSLFNECKELLFYCEKSFKGEAVIEAINVGNTEYAFSFFKSQERKAIVSFSDPKDFLYEPNASILKGGAFKTVASAFDLMKLHPNTHLYTSNKYLDDFPGRIFRVHAQIKIDSKTIASYFPSGRASMVTRNYPLSVDALRKKTKLKDGGDNFLIGCSGVNKKFLIVASVLQHF